MLGIVSYVWLLSVLCIQFGDAENRSQKFTLRREGYRLKSSLDLQEVACSSLSACLASCTQNTSCQAVSFEDTGGRCVMAMETSRFTVTVLSDIEPVSRWTTMARWIYTVLHMEGPLGVYSVAFQDAAALCAGENSVLASPADLLESKAMGLYFCACGWLSDGTNGYVLQFSAAGCGTVAAGINYCSRSTANVWCLL